MNDDKYQIISINYTKDKNLDYSEKRHRTYNKELNSEKYEKFQPKNTDSYYKIKTLRREENKVKNLLSIFLKNYENEELNSGILSEVNKDNNNKKRLKKVKTDLSNKKLNKINSFMNSSNNNSKMNNTNEEILDNYKSKKIKFKLDRNSLNSLNNSPKKERNLKRNLTCGKIKKKENNNNKFSQNKTSKNLHYNNTNFLIKKEQSQQNSYLNFKNDKTFLTKYQNQKQNNNLFSIKSPMKLKKGILKKRIKNNIFNNSNNNSFLSDISDNKLIRKSFDKNSNYKIDALAKNKRRTSFFSIKAKKSLSIIKSNLKNLIYPKKKSFDLNEIKNKKKLSNLQKSLVNNKGIKFNIKRADISANTQKNIISNVFRFENNLKSLKEKLKKSLILFPEESDNSQKNEVKLKNKTIINKINKKNYNNNIKKLQKALDLNNDNNNLKTIKNEKLSKSNIIKFDSHSKIQNLDLTKGQNNILQKESNNNKNIEDSNKFQDNKSSVRINNLESKKTIKSIIGSTKNSLLEEHTTYSNKGKKMLYYEKYRILTHKPNLYDSLDDEEFDDEEELNKIYLDPNSNFNIIFDFILFIFNLFSLFYIPLYLAINHNFCKNNHITFNFAINFTVELLNILDIFFGFIRAYYDWEELLVKKKRIISFKYVTGWFLFDLLSSIPFYTIIKIYEPLCQKNKIYSKYANTVTGNLRYLLISNRLLKVFKIFLYNQAWKIISNKLNEYGNITVYSIIFLASINYSACIFIFIGKNTYPNWIFQSNLDAEPFIIVYICAIYVITMAVTTVGYGDITCYSLSETIFQLFILNIGIIGYSFIVSFLSNYIQKINEKSVDFEKRKSILDEIRRSNPNFPVPLYDRIIRYLKFKNFHEKKLKNIIFDCLPIGLKNNLISEMYKPIITNFVFFKNFHNTDFNVRVILAFKPIIAYKNDILVNEGDMIEDIMFVKKGALSVELPINMVNPEENIEKYLNTSFYKIEKGPNVQKIGNSTIIPENNQNMKNLIKSINEPNLTKKKTSNKYSSLYNYPSLMKYNPIFNKNFSLIEKERKEREKIELEKKRNIKYIKIIGIRENEHFGDVLMFLEQRSPLRVRVKSVKCELFFLKKIDAVEISTNYQNIWKNINIKSVFNYEQMKKSIKNIVEIYCSAKKIKSNNNNKELSIDRINRKQKDKNINKKKYNSNKSGFKILKGNLIYSKSYKIPKTNYSVFFKNIEMNNDLFIKDNNNNKKNCLSAKQLQKKMHINIDNKNKKLKVNSSSLSLSLNNKKKSKKKKKEKKSNKTNNNIKIKSSKSNINQKVLDAFNDKYKFYKRTTKENYHKNEKIISEETEQDVTTENYQNNNLKKNFSKIASPTYNRNNIMPSTMVYKPSSFNINMIKNNKNIKDNNEKEKSDIFYDKIINDELNQGEVIKVIKEENLLNKKIDFDNISTKQSEFYINNVDYIEHKNKKLKKLLNCFEDENEKNRQKDNIKNIQNNKNNGSIINEKSNESINSSSNNIEQNKDFSNKNFNYIFDNNYNNDSSKKCATSINNKIKTNNFLEINKNISFKVDSSYDNLNLISGNILIKNKFLQNKLKIFLLDEIQNSSYRNHNNKYTTNTNVFEKIKKMNSLGKSTQYNNLEYNFMNPIKNKKEDSSPKMYNSNKNIKYNNNKDFNNLYTIGTESFSKILKYSSALGNLQRNKKDKIKQNIFPSLIESDFDDKLINKKRQKRRENQREISDKNANKINIINNNINYINNSIIDIQKKVKGKRQSAAILSPFIKSKKNKNNVISQINFNIQKTNQKLNNPDEFYSNYFNSILKNRQNKKRNTFFFGNKNNDLFKNQKGSIKKRNTISKIN